MLINLSDLTEVIKRHFVSDGKRDIQVIADVDYISRVKLTMLLT